MSEMTKTNTLAIQFRSTSTLPGSGSAYSSTPTLNTDGTAAYNTSSYSPALSSGPRRSGTPGGNPADGNQQPLGDAPWLLVILLVAIYGIVKAVKAVKTKKNV